MSRHPVGDLGLGGIQDPPPRVSPRGWWESLEGHVAYKLLLVCSVSWRVPVPTEWKRVGLGRTLYTAPNKRQLPTLDFKVVNRLSVDSNLNPL